MKSKIIEVSIEKFNEFGVKQTSFRDIAAQISVSDGHVRYYFKTKELLLLAIFEKMDLEILQVAANLPTKALQPLELFQSKIQNVFTIMVAYRFFFIESPSLYNLYPKLRLAYRNLMANRKTLFLNTFDKLTQIGFFNADFTFEKQEIVFYKIFILSDSWIRYFTILENKKPTESDILFHSNLIVSILKPYIVDFKEH